MALTTALASVRACFKGHRRPLFHGLDSNYHAPLEGRHDLTDLRHRHLVSPPGHSSALAAIAGQLSLTQTIPARTWKIIQEQAFLIMFNTDITSFHFGITLEEGRASPPPVIRTVAVESL